MSDQKPMLAVPRQPPNLCGECGEHFLDGVAHIPENRKWAVAFCPHSSTLVLAAVTRNEAGLATIAWWSWESPVSLDRAREIAGELGSEGAGLWIGPALTIQ